MSESEIIDELLSLTAAGRFVVLTKANTNLEFLATEKATAYGLVIRDKHSFNLTEKGHRVIEAGGFDRWKAANEKRENEEHQAVIDSSKATVDAAISARHSKFAAWFASAVGVVATLLTFYQIWKGNESENKLSVMQKRIDIMDSLMRARHQGNLRTLSGVHSSTLSGTVR